MALLSTNDDLKEIIARNMAALRRRDRLTQADLAEKLHYSDKAISKWERAESVPDIAVLKQIADLFRVTVDDLISEDCVDRMPKLSPVKIMKNKRLITELCILLVWLIATSAYVILSISAPAIPHVWLSFIYAVPVSMIVWLTMNAIWFNAQLNYLIISLLVWSVLTSIYLTFLMFGNNFWLLFALGIPSQAIIILWSRITYKKKI